jgi:hypothetical protein
MIDNLEQIKKLLNFSEPGDFYMLYVFKRKKDQPEGERDNHQSVRTIKSYCIESIDHLERRWEEIKQLCEMFKARAYIHVQKQNHRDVSLNMMVALAQRIQDGDHKQQGLFDSVVGQVKTQEKRWIVDIDVKDTSTINEIKNCIEYTNPMKFTDLDTGEFESKIEAVVPTKNGFHLITKRFDVMEFRKRFPDIGIQKKNPTIVYYPNSLEQ